jgi:Holliday junction resolvasome RuvABC ATP-dependent DNA helicase subunit
MGDLSWLERHPNHPAVTGEMLRVRGPSNIYSIGYDCYNQFVYVRFREGPDESRERNCAGALFRYADVSLNAFLDLLENISRADQWVWENLRHHDSELVGVIDGRVPLPDNKFSPSAMTTRPTEYPPDHPICTGKMVSTPDGCDVEEVGYEYRTSCLYVIYGPRAHATAQFGRRRVMCRYERVVPQAFVNLLANLGGVDAWVKENLGEYDEAIRFAEPQGESEQRRRELGASEDAAPARSDADLVREATEELGTLIGLKAVKLEVERLLAFLVVQKERERHGLRPSVQTLHFVFTGNPGTGKTTVARIIAKLLCGLGFLKTAKLVECARSDLVGGYLGQTAIKTDGVIESALDGVLFIDEAYSLTHGFEQDSFGREAVETLLKRMEDDRDRLVVVVAGYTQPMAEFLETNPGLKSRFTRFIHFPDYEVADLCQIFEAQAREQEYTLSNSCRANACLFFWLSHRTRDATFGNARLVRNVFQEATARLSQRLARRAEGGMDKTTLQTLEGEDIPLEWIDKTLPGTVDLTEAKWKYACAKCGKAGCGGMKFLGRAVSCSCGEKFVFPWWDIEPGTVRGLPSSLLTGP